MQVGFLNKLYTGVKTVAHSATSSPVLKSRTTIFTEHFPIAKDILSPYQIKFSLQGKSKKALTKVLGNIPAAISENNIVGLLGDIGRSSKKGLKTASQFPKESWSHIPKVFTQKPEDAITIMQSINTEKLSQFKPEQLKELWSQTSPNLNATNFCNIVENITPQKLELLQKENFGNIPKEVFAKFGERNFIEFINTVKPQSLEKVSEEAWSKVLSQGDKIEGNGIIRYLKTGKSEELLKKTPKIEFVGKMYEYQVPGSKALPIKKNPSKGVEISNFDKPRGTVSIKTTPQETLYTKGLLQCAGLAIYDPKTNTQSLNHIFVGTTAHDIKAHLTKIHPEETFKNEGLEISIVNGCYMESENTINKILEVIHSINPKAADKVEFRHFPTADNEVLGMQNGKLFATSKAKATVVNPMDRISHC